MNKTLDLELLNRYFISSQVAKLILSIVDSLEDDRRTVYL